ncbi:MAG: D-Ala-D-Ala carboxypeptidase family metallohydrolase [Nannocystaceae bacterium]
MGIRGPLALSLLLASCVDAGQGRAPPQWQGPGAHTAGDDGDGGDGLDVDPIDSSSSGAIPEGEGEGGDEGFHCDPEAVQACPCPDGAGEGVQACIEGLWGPCECAAGSSDGGEAGGGSSDGGEVGSTGEPEPLPTEVCYPGADGSYATCLPVVAFDPDAPPEGYAYPDPPGGDPNYRRPVALLDLESLDPDTALAPNFTLGELAQAVKGRWGIVQPHAVESLQALRDDNGALAVNSGYRSPDYNAQIGGAGYSRHTYGDGFDLDPLAVDIDTLELACVDQGGMLVEYETHVHCDFRFDDVEIAFFGPADAPAPVQPRLRAAAQHGGGVWWAQPQGFDEGLPTIAGSPATRAITCSRRGRGLMFVPPSGTVTVELDVGRAAVRLGVPEVGIEPT